MASSFNMPDKLKTALDMKIMVDVVLFDLARWAYFVLRCRGKV